MIHLRAVKHQGIAVNRNRLTSTTKGDVPRAGRSTNLCPAADRRLSAKDRDHVHPRTVLYLVNAVSRAYPAGGRRRLRPRPRLPQRPAPKALLLGNIPADPRAAPKRKTGLSRWRSRVSSQQLGPELAVAVADQGQLQHSPNNLQTDKLLTRRVATTRAPRFQSMWVI